MNKSVSLASCLNLRMRSKRRADKVQCHPVLSFFFSFFSGVKLRGKDKGMPLVSGGKGKK